jgi:hypothetical protein
MRLPLPRDIQKIVADYASDPLYDVRYEIGERIKMGQTMFDEFCVSFCARSMLLVYIRRLLGENVGKDKLIHFYMDNSRPRVLTIPLE